MRQPELIHYRAPLTPSAGLVLMTFLDSSFRVDRALGRLKILVHQ
jgi:hypothetical protein